MPVSVTSYVVRVLYGPRQPRCHYLDRGNHVPVIYVDTVDLVHIFGSVHIRLTIRASSPLPFFALYAMPSALCITSITTAAARADAPPSPSRVFIRTRSSLT